MHVVVSGWFWDQPGTGSGQYINRLLPHLIALAAPNGAEGGVGSESAGLGHASTQLLDSEGAPGCTLLLPRTLPDSTHPIPLSTVVAPPPRLPRQLAKLYWEQITVPRCARRMQADLLLVPYWAAPLWQPVPTVVTVHDLIPLLLPAYRGGWLGRLYTGLVSHTARRSTAVLTVSEAGKRDLIAHLKLPAERVFAVHHGPNETASRMAHDGSRRDGQHAPGDDTQCAIRAKYALPERYFLYLGGFDARKNVSGIMRAYRRYLDQGGDPAVQLVMAGTLPRADTDFFPDPQRLVRQLELTGRVRFIGWVEEADKVLLYAGATAFLFPSAYEGFGMMLLEAMAAGAPVITSSE